VNARTLFHEDVQLRNHKRNLMQRFMPFLKDLMIYKKDLHLTLITTLFYMKPQLTKE